MKTSLKKYKTMKKKKITMKNVIMNKWERKEEKKGDISKQQTQQCQTKIW